MDEDERKPIEGLPADYVVVHLDASVPYNYRRVFGINWEEVVDYLNAKGYSVIVTGNHVKHIKGARVFKGSVRQLIRLIHHARFFIGVDSGPSQIAASLKVPSLIFFGSVNPAFRHFQKMFRGTFLQQPCEFSGCYHEVVGGSGQPCRIVGNEGAPQCCTHTTESVLRHIDLLLEKYYDRQPAEASRATTVAST